MTSIKFTLKDRQKNPHNYESMMLPAAESLPIAQEIMALGSAPLVRLVGQQINGGEPDWAGIAEDLPAVLRSLKPEMITKILSNTFRDGKDLGHGPTFDAAYSGNWGELYQAIWKVVDANGFLDFFDSLSTIVE